MVTQGGREVTWQVEYPLTRTLTSEVQTLIRMAPQDLGGIVPLAMVRNGYLCYKTCKILYSYLHTNFCSVIRKNGARQMFTEITRKVLP